MAESEKAQVQSPDAPGVNILRWEDDGGQTIGCRDRTDRFTAEPATRNNHPSVPVLADGILLGLGALSIYVHPRALAVMAGSALTESSSITQAVDSKLAADG